MYIFLGYKLHTFFLAYRRDDFYGRLRYYVFTDVAACIQHSLHILKHAMRDKRSSICDGIL